MSDELVLYTHPMSRGRIARWMLEEVGAPYRTELLSYCTTMKAPAYLAINPMGKVPALRHGEDVVTECAAICAYLADAFPDAGLAPPPDRRARYYRWLFFAAGPLEAAVTANAFGLELSQEQQVMAGYGSLAAALDTLEQAVAAGPYLAGDSFSAADLYVGAQLGFCMQAELIQPRPAFTSYWARVSDRDAKRRADALDDAAQEDPALAPAAG